MISANVSDLNEKNGWKDITAAGTICEGGKRLDFDFMHCKGCGICFKVCPFKAITWEKEEK
jgi:Pyruvate/2-oxoacid:ferredoxin oxidoreductase delta subunit